MKLFKKLIFSSALALGLTPLIAQTDIQLPIQYGMQQLISNPALLQDHKVSISLPSVGAGFYTPISVNDMGEVRNGTLFIDPDQFILRLNERGNSQTVNLNVETLGLNLRFKKWQIGASHRARVLANFDLPKDLVKLAAYGNGPYVGEQMQIAPALDISAFQEFGVHAGFTLSEQFTIGGRLKYLVGSAAMATTTNNVSLFSDPDYYEATISSDYTVKTAGVPVSFGEDGVEVGDLEDFANAGTGFGADIGMTFRPNEDMELGISFRDIGSISWNNQARVHRSNGSYTFSGYQGNVFEEDDFDLDFAGIVDTIVSELEFNTEERTFVTQLPTTAQMAFRYRLAKTTTVNATVFSANNRGWRSGFGVGLGQQLGKIFHAGALAGVKRGEAYLGANILIDLWGPQFYVSCDNLLAISDLSKANDAYVRAGINLAFGQIRMMKEYKGWYDTKIEGINK